MFNGVILPLVQYDSKVWGRLRALPTGTNTQQKLYKQNPVDTFYMCTEKHQHMNYADA